MKEKILLYLKGIAMGAADVVPGVSGGTIAFISGIYEELVDSLKSIDTQAVKLLLKFDFKGFWVKINADFLFILFFGILTSVLSLSGLILYILSNYPELLWAFFFGLIVASVILVGKKVKTINIASIIAFIIGGSIAFYVTIAIPAETPTTLWFVFLSGALVICAMILPGISGAFILLLIGKYEFILNALKDLKISIIALFGLGCIVGLLTFSRFLSFILNKYHDFTIALLTGFMVGSLNKVWPWKKTIDTFINRHGVKKPLIQSNISPLNYHDITGNTPYLFESIALAIFGFVLVYGIEKFEITSDGIKYKNNRYTKRYGRELKEAQQHLSSKE